MKIDILTLFPEMFLPLKNYFKETNTVPHDYDVIYTGDLGTVGTQLLYELMDTLGEEDFQHALKEYYNTYKNKIAKTQDFLEIIESL